MEHSQGSDTRGDFLVWGKWSTKREHKECLSPASPFTLLSDALGVDRLPAYAKVPNKLTDGHLLGLARHHGAKLATLDTGILGALLIPAS